MANELEDTVVKNLFFIANFFNLVKIDKVVVPELVELSSNEVILDCQYTVVDDNFTLQWSFNNAATPVYEWSPRSEPKVAGILDGRLDSTYRASTNLREERRSLRITKLSPDLSGNYTCIIMNRGKEARQTKTMVVYSVEKEFELTAERQKNASIIDVSCLARGLYPQPELTIEYKNVMLSGQYQRVWRNGGPLYDVICYAQINGQTQTDTTIVACRLKLPQVDYTAIKKKIIYSEGVNNSNSSIISSSKRLIQSLYLLLLIKSFHIYL